MIVTPDIRSKIEDIFTECARTALSADQARRVGLRAARKWLDEYADHTDGPPLVRDVPHWLNGCRITAPEIFADVIVAADFTEAHPAREPVRFGSKRHRAMLSAAELGLIAPAVQKSGASRGDWRTRPLHKFSDEILDAIIAHRFGHTPSPSKLRDARAALRRISAALPAPRQTPAKLKMKKGSPAS